ncbi:MAG: hypothetical protein ACO1OB_13660 [Archangium sp.]
MKRAALGVVVLALGVGVWRLVTPTKSNEAPARLLFRQVFPDWQVARSRGEAPKQFETLQLAADSWPSLKPAFDDLEAAWPEREAVTTASYRLNDLARDAGLDFWVDPMFVGRATVITTYEILERVNWSVVSDGGIPDTIEALHVRRLDGINLEVGLLGHASGSQPAILRDRVEVSVLNRLRLDPDEKQNRVDELTNSLWREQVNALVDAKGLAEAERRVNLREKLLFDMEKRLKGGKVEVARPQRLVFGDAYFESLEPYTSTRRRGGPLFLASDLRALQAADEALSESAELQTLVQVIDLESRIVEAHEVRHALDKRELDVPPYLQQLVGADDLRFGRMSERELRAFIGELHDSKAPACLTVLSLAQLARGHDASSTPHFFAAHALLATLADLDAPTGLTRQQVLEVTTSLCALPDAELRAKAAAAMETLYGVPMLPLVHF